MMTETIRSILACLIVLGVLVFFHELGHYLAARARGVVVEVFSIGFGPTLFSWRARSGTVWKISALPLGGYVKMQGWEDDQHSPKRPGSFGTADLVSKAFIIAAGPMANMILAFVLFTGVLLVDGQVVLQPVLSHVQPGSQAAKGGLLPGDRILTVDGQSIDNFMDMVGLVAGHPNANIRITFSRAGAIMTKEIMTGQTDLNGTEIGYLGVEGDQSTSIKLSPIAAVTDAGAQTLNLIEATATGLTNLVLHGRGAQDLGGPLRIAQISGKVAATGVSSMVSFIATLSVNLGLVNLVPIPLLDGGYLLFFAGEAIFRKPVPKRLQEFGLRCGFALLLSLFVFTTVNDLTQMGAVHWAQHLFG
jgi:regulator of sigma E protease